MAAEDFAAGPHPSLREASLVWFRIGCLGFGGPAGQIALMHRTLVEEKRWVDEGRFLHALNFCMLLPGPEAQQLATYIGWLLHGTRGGVIAGTLFILPGLVVILAMSTAYSLFQGTEWLSSVFFGLKAAILAIVVQAMIRIGRRALKDRVAVVIAAVSFVAIFAVGIPFPLIILAAAIAGFALAAVRPPADVATNARPVAGARARHRPLAVIAVWGSMWAAPVAAAIFLFGPASIFAALGLYFSQMAVVTFGGAYAVLAYVAQTVVTTYGWLRPEEMIDGLALAETTPGPLILVLTFVGFLAAHANPGSLSPLAAGFLGALLTTWVTFVPSFLWIFLGAPYVERLRANRWLSGALTAITAAVVGIVLNLTLYLALHVLFADVGVAAFGPVRFAAPAWASFDPLAGLIAAGAAVALFGFRLGMLPTLALACAAGVAARLVW